MPCHYFESPSSCAFPLDNECFVEGVLPKPSWVRLDKVYTLNAGLFVGRFAAFIQKCMSGLKGISMSILDGNCSSDCVGALDSVMQKNLAPDGEHVIKDIKFLKYQLFV